MLYRLCAWSLLVLALSPFTAPFATCDLATLLGRHMGHERIVHQVDYADLSAIEALSVSPLIARTLLDHPRLATDPLVSAAREISALTVVQRTSDAASRAQLRQLPPEYVAQATVLRL